MDRECNSPSVTVVMPVHNGGAYIAEALDCIEAQRCEDMEVIIVDDRSTDCSLSIAEQWIADTTIVGRLIRQSPADTPGVASARNVGVAAARGELIAFLDQDDLWTPDKLEVQKKKFDEFPQFSLLACVPDLLFETDERDPVITLWRAFVDSLAAPPVRELTSQDIVSTAPLCMSSVTVRKEALRAIGGFSPDLRWTSDWEAWIRLSFHYRLGLIPNRLVTYRLHEGNDFRNLQKQKGAIAEARMLRERISSSSCFAGLNFKKNGSFRMTKLSAPTGWN